MITIIDKYKIQYHLESLGIRTHRVDGVVFCTTGQTDEEVQAAVDAYNPLPEVKESKINGLKAEGLSRIQLTFPSISDFDELDLVREQWLSIAPAARSATTDFQRMIDIVQAGKAAVTSIKALTTVSNVEAYDVVGTPSWPA